MMKTKDTSAKPSVASAVRRRVTKREIVLIVAVALVVAAAIIGFALYNAARVPADAAAKVNDSYLSEERVADQIAQYRAGYSLSDDTDFANALLAQNLNVDTFRQIIINQLVLSDLISQRAEELGIEASEEEAQAQVDGMKRNMAFDDDELWNETLAGYGLSEDIVRSQYLANLRQQAVLEADVARREPTEAETLAYISTYLTGTTQKHTSRILFVGEDIIARSQECYDWLAGQADDDGSISAEVFAQALQEYSDEEGAVVTGGAFGWSGSSALNEDIMTILEYLDVGSFSRPQSAGENGVLEIIYCDGDYTFPAADDISSLALSDVPKDLRELIESAAAEELWTQDCNAYLAALISDAQITYYPVPRDAPYAVDMALASTQGSDE